MIKYRVEETINRPVSDVFPYVADPLRHPMWMDVSEVRVATPGQMRVGDSATAMLKLGSTMIPYTFEVTEYREDASLAFRSTAALFSWEGRFEVSPTNGAATRIIGSGEVSLKGWKRIMEPFMSGEVRRGEADELRRLKELLERPA